MAEKKPKREKGKTPAGEAKWAHLITPKPPFKGEDKDPKFEIEVHFDPKDSEWGPWAKVITDRVRALPQQYDHKNAVPGEAPAAIPKKYPIKNEIGPDEKPTGRCYATFRTSAKYKPELFDKFGRPYDDDVRVGNGSKVRIAYSVNEFESFGGGIGLYLEAVQVLDLVDQDKRSAESYGFEVEKSEPGAFASSASAAPTLPEDDLPF